MPVSASTQTELRRKFISDAFHTLNQPLTGLHCGLEIALQKPRSVGEYRKRISDGIDNAGSVLQLMRAVRELVDATDPGERYGTVSLALLLAQLKSELEVVAEAARVSLQMQDVDTHIKVLADPGKLTSALGGLIAAEIENHEPGAVVRVRVEAADEQVTITVSGVGARKQTEWANGSRRLIDIRKNAACSYLWTLDGDCEQTPNGIAITLALSPDV